MSGTIAIADATIATVDKQFRALSLGRMSTSIDRVSLRSVVRRVALGA